MQEKTLPKPLSGLEVRKAILAKIEQKLSQDCTLREIEAYPSFSFDATIAIRFQTLGKTNSTEVRAMDAGGEVVEGLPVEVEHVQVADAEKPPNQVRLESQQGIPTLTKTPAGKVKEERPKYAQPGFAAGGK
jgi:hypothetical protein